MTAARRWTSSRSWPWPARCAVGEPFAGAMITVDARHRAGARGARRRAGPAGAEPARRARPAQRATPDPGRTWSRSRSRRSRAATRCSSATGEVVPVDGRLVAAATLDESALTGEPLPVERQRGRRGAQRRGQRRAAGRPGRARPRRQTPPTPGWSGWSSRRRPPPRRSSGPPTGLAVAFVPLTLLAGRRRVVVGGDPVRAVAVLVVATPCPLLLAAPIAIMSGLSRAARLGVIVKGGGALERLAARPGDAVRQDRDADPGPADRRREVVIGRRLSTPTRCCGSRRALDQVSPHVLAERDRRRGAGAAACRWSCPSTSWRSTATGCAGPSTARACASARPDWIVGPDPAAGSARCAGGRTSTGR